MKEVIYRKTVGLGIRFKPIYIYLIYIENRTKSKIITPETLTKLILKPKAISSFYLKIVGVGLLLVFISAQFFGFIYWKKEQIYAKAEAFVAKQKSELVSLSFYTSEVENLDWEDEKEFSFKGLMYDVVKTSSNGDSTTFMCYADEKETWIVHEIEELTKEFFGKSTKSKKQETTNQTIDIFSQDFFAWQFPSFYFVKTREEYFFNFLYTSRSTSIVHQPPRIG